MDLEYSTQIYIFLFVLDQKVLNKLFEQVEIFMKHFIILINQDDIFLPFINKQSLFIIQLHLV